MKRIIFDNPPNDLFVTLKILGITNLFVRGLPETDKFKGLPLSKLCIDGISSNASWGNMYFKKNMTADDNVKLFHKSVKEGEPPKWTCATIDLTDEGLSLLRKSNLKYTIVNID